MEKMPPSFPVQSDILPAPIASNTVGGSQINHQTYQAGFRLLDRGSSVLGR
ncbi:MAG: hypothetical protein RLZZ568_1808 [Cyanobacteriota bacterium]|jgi:hypothetical protein